MDQSREMQDNPGPGPDKTELSKRGFPERVANGDDSRSRIKDWSIIGVSILGILAAAGAYGQRMMTSTVAPIIERLDQIDEGVQKLDEYVHNEFNSVDDEFKAVRGEIAALRERLARVETKLDSQNQDRGQRTSNSPTPVLQLTPVRLPCHP